MANIDRAAQSFAQYIHGTMTDDWYTHIWVGISAGSVLWIAIWAFTNRKTIFK